MLTAVETPATPALRRRETAENFPVALRFLPAGLRRDLHAVYAVARTIDEIGDDVSARPLPTQRLAGLDEFEADLLRIWSGTTPPRHPVSARLAPTVHDHGLPAAPFRALIDANRLDQCQHRYETWLDLRHYCSLSADPIGRIVLGIVDAATPQRFAWSDDACTALQLLEHCQDVAEDRRRGRIYLPLDTLAAYGVDPADLDASGTAPTLRRAVAHETERARTLLEHSGPALVATLHGAARCAVAGFVAGGLATADALHRANYDVLTRTPRPAKPAIARHAFRLVMGTR